MDQRYDEGIEKGIEKGILQVATALLNQGVASPLIVEATGLSMDTIEELLKNS